MIWRFGTRCAVGLERSQRSQPDSTASRKPHTVPYSVVLWSTPYGRSEVECCGTVVDGGWLEWLRWRLRRLHAKIGLGASTATVPVWANHVGDLGLSLIYLAIFLHPCPLPISPVSAHSNRPLPIFFGVEGNQTRPMWCGRPLSRALPDSKLLGFPDTSTSC